MIQPSIEVIRAICACNKQHSAFAKWLNAWYEAELSKLPIVLQNTAFAQGRCQVLQELCKIVNQSPETLAKLDKGS